MEKNGESIRGPPSLISDVSSSSEHSIPTPSDSLSSQTGSPVVEPYPASDSEESDEVREARRRKKGKGRAVNDTEETQESRQTDLDAEEEDAFDYFSYFRSLTEASERVGESSACPPEETTNATFVQDSPCANIDISEPADFNDVFAERTLYGFAQTVALLASNVAKNDSRLAWCTEYDFKWLINDTLNHILELMGQSDQSLMYSPWDLRPIRMGGLVYNEVYDYNVFILNDGEAGFRVVQDASEAAISWELQGYPDTEFLVEALLRRVTHLPSEFGLLGNEPYPQDGSVSVQTGDQIPVPEPPVPHAHEPVADYQTAGTSIGSESIHDAQFYDPGNVAQQPLPVQAPSSPAPVIPSQPQRPATRPSRQVIPPTVNNTTFKSTLIPVNDSVPTRGKKRTIFDDMVPETVRCRYPTNDGQSICNEVFGCREDVFKHMRQVHSAFEPRNNRTHCRFVTEGTNVPCEDNYGKGFANKAGGLRKHLNSHYDNNSQSVKRPRRE